MLAYHSSFSNQVYRETQPMAIHRNRYILAVIQWYRRRHLRSI